MNKLLLLVLGLVFCTNAFAAKEPGYQVAFNLGADYPSSGSSRGTAFLAHLQLGTYSKFMRFHGAFTALKGSGYQAGEGAMGTTIYPLTKFVAERARVHPFLIGQGTVAVARVGSTNRQDFGYSFGAGVDLKLARSGGFTMSAQKFVATEESMRFHLGFFWFRDPE